MILAMILAMTFLDRPSTPVQFASEIVLVDEIEVNRWTSDAWRNCQTQLIYKRWHAGRLCVIGWRMGKPEEVALTDAGYAVKHKGYTIRANEILHTNSTYDTERREFARFGYGERVAELCGGW